MEVIQISVKVIKLLILVRLIWWIKSNLSKEISSQWFFQPFAANIGQQYWLDQKSECFHCWWNMTTLHFWLHFHKNRKKMTGIQICFSIFQPKRDNLHELWRKCNLNLMSSCLDNQMWITQSKTFSALKQVQPFDQRERFAQTLSVGQRPLCPAWLFPAVSQLREYKDPQRV